MLLLPMQEAKGILQQFNSYMQPPPVRNKYSWCWGRQMLRLIKVNRTM